MRLKPCYRIEEVEQFCIDGPDQLGLKLMQDIVRLDKKRYSIQEYQEIVHILKRTYYGYL